MRIKELHKREKLLFIFPLGLLAVPLLLRVTKPVDLIAKVDLRGDALDRAIRRRVGYAQDCGTVPIGVNRASSQACAVSAFKAKQPFRVRYIEQGDDSEHATAIAGTAQGQVFIYRYDSLMGTGNVGDSVYESTCIGPYIYTSMGQEHIGWNRLK